MPHRALGLKSFTFLVIKSNAVLVSKECFDLAFMWAITGLLHYGASGH